MCEALWKQLDGDCIELTLDCGEVWNSPPPEVEALAFETPADGQAYAEKQYQTNRYG
jgi:hypothetical protein